MGAAYQRLKRLLRSLVVAGLTVLTASCTATSGPATDSALGPSPFIDEKLLSMVYERIDTYYVDPIDMRLLAIEGLSGLSSIDPNITVKLTDDSVLLLSGERTIYSQPAPGPHEGGAWGRATAWLATYAARHSAALRTTPENEIVSAILARATTLLDTSSRYTNPDRARVERAERDGYSGIGVELERTGDFPVITAVYPGSPAERAGLTANTSILAIDDKSTERLDIDAVEELLRGPLYSIVALDVQRTNGAATRVELSREIVVRSTLNTYFDDGAGVIRLDRFNVTTGRNLARALYLLHGYGSRLKGFVIDLRGNVGGLLSQAVDVSDLFMDQGVIIEARGRHPDSLQRYVAHGGDQAHQLPVVVLVDGGSASAAEIVAAALRDSGRALLVGTSTFGKGSVQTVTRLPNQGELFLTWARLHGPSGRTFNRIGVIPGLCTNPPNGLPGLTALESLRNGHSAWPWLPTQALAPRLEMGSEDIPDPALVMAVRQACPALVGRRDIDMDVARMLLRDPPLFARALAAQRQQLGPLTASTNPEVVVQAAENTPPAPQ
jgi:carboxyl-terminal processing protease